MMMHVLNNVPSAYDNVVKTLEDTLEATTDPLRIELSGAVYNNRIPY